jgi:hypothetical protein
MRTTILAAALALLPDAGTLGNISVAGWINSTTLAYKARGSRGVD